MENKYTYHKNHRRFLEYSVMHTEDEKETFIAITDSAEKADFITKSLNAMTGIDDPQKFREDYERMKKSLQTIEGIIEKLDNEHDTETFDYDAGDVLMRIEEAVFLPRD